MKAIRCKCGSVYPDDMDKCPTCQCQTHFNIDNVLTESKEVDVRKSDPSEWRPVQIAKNHTQKSNYKKNSQSPNIHMVSCVVCNAKISAYAESCPHCGQPTGVHVCPRCNGTDTKVISGASKVASIFLWGPFAANKVISRFECKKCGHKW